MVESYVPRNYLNSFGMAIFLHAILLALLFFTWEIHSPPPGLVAGRPIIQATAILSTPAVHKATPVASAPPPPPPVKTKEKSPPKAIEKEKAVAVQKQITQEAEKKRQLEKQKKEKLLKEQREKALQEKFAREQQEEATRRAQVLQGVVDKYKAEILLAISQYWIVPPNTDKRLSADLLLRLAPDGTVLEVKLIKSSGNDLLDQSAITAVQKASPLPVPSEPDAFKVFREIKLTVKPDFVAK
jgi:TonB family protein